MYPPLCFSLHYREDGCCFKGVAQASDGVTTDQCLSW